MARPLRVEYEGPLYHITSRGNARQDVFLVDPDRELFLNTLAETVNRVGWICQATTGFLTAPSAVPLSPVRSRALS